MAFSRVAGSNIRLNHSTPCLLLVQPLGLQLKLQSYGVDAEIQVLLIEAALKITKGRRAILSVLIHSTIETHSCRPG